MIMIEGLLRKYKISKIIDTVKLSEQESRICNYLDMNFLNLNSKPYKYNIRYSNDKNETSFIYEYNTKTLSVDYRIIRFLINSNYLTRDEYKIIIIHWVIDIYDLEIKSFDIL